MRFQFSERSKLYGRMLRHKIDCFVSAECSEENVEKHVFCYRAEIPLPSDEPDLYRGATVSDDGSGSVSLRYPGIDEVILLLTSDADDRFRAENGPLVAANERFRIDSLLAMRFQFSERSKLYGRVLRHEIDRFAFVPRSEEGLTEYIFCYRDKVPLPSEEPALYRDAGMAVDGPGSVSLRYSGIDEVVFLLTCEADDRFRAENGPLVAANELFRID